MFSYLRKLIFGEKEEKPSPFDQALTASIPVWVIYPYQIDGWDKGSISPPEMKEGRLLEKFCGQDYVYYPPTNPDYNGIMTNYTNRTIWRTKEEADKEFNRVMFEYGMFLKEKGLELIVKYIKEDVLEELSK